jgi:hypothetical protein
VPLADAAYLRFGDAASAAQRLHQGNNLPGGNAAGVGLHHHGIEGLVHLAAWLEPIGKEAALPQLLLRRSLAAMGWPG